MIRNWTLIKVLALAAILLAACTQDELAEQDNTLPEGEYPLQIGSVSITAESSEEPWTRVAENEDGTGSEWEWDGMEKFAVRLGDETAVYTLNPDHTMTADRQLYWKSTAPATVTAWYPVVETVDLSGQDKGLVYVLRATADNASYDTPVSLQFKHQLAKVRVVLSGTQAGEVEKVEVHNYTSCTHVSGGNVVGSTEGWITMHRVDAATYEANVVPGTINLADFICLNGTTVVTNLTGLPTTLEAGTMYTANITVGEPVLQDGTTLTEAGTYNMQGTYTQGITISGTGITVKLDGVTLNTSDIGINVQSDATIQVSGADNTITSGSAGIYVAENSTVTIQGNSTEDALTCEGNNLSAGIGGYMIDNNTAYNCGNIVIDNVTLTARSGQTSNVGNYAAGIGAAANAKVGSISISNAIIYANGGGDNSTMGAAAIGGGIDYLNLSGQTEFDITISNSTIHATRGCSYASYIGAGGWHGGTAGYNIISTANITGSIIYDESGTEITQ